MEIKKPFDRGWGKPHPKCSKKIDEYEEVLDKQGVKVLQKKGEIDFYDEIQAHGECVEIKDVIKRYKLNLKDLPKTEIEETIKDMNNMPSDWTEAQNIIARTKNTFGLLPKEERAMFNNNAEEFVKAIIEKNDKFKILQNKVNSINESMQAPTSDKVVTGSIEQNQAQTTPVTTKEETNE